MKTLIATIVRPGQFSPEVMEKLAQDLRDNGKTTNPLSGKECRVIEVHNDGRGITVTLDVSSDLHDEIINGKPGSMSMGCKVEEPLCGLCPE